MSNAASIFSINATEQQAEALARNPFVLQVEEVDEIRLSTVQSLPPPFPIGGKTLWNLDRIDQLGTADLRRDDPRRLPQWRLGVWQRQLHECMSEDNPLAALSPTTSRADRSAPDRRP